MIRVSEVGAIPYDHLLLTCGLQYQLPTRLVPRPARPFSDRRPLYPPALLPEAPENVFRVNSQYDAERALDYVRAYCLERNGETGEGGKGARLCQGVLSGAER